MENNTFGNIFDITKIKNMESFTGESSLRIKSELFERKDNPIKSFTYSFAKLEFEEEYIYLMISEFWNLILVKYENGLDIYDKAHLIYSGENIVGKEVKINAWDDNHCYIYLYDGDKFTEVIFLEKKEDKFSFSELKCKEGIDAFDANRSSGKDKPLLEDVLFITRSNELYSYNFNLIYEGFYSYEFVSHYNPTGFMKYAFYNVVVFYDNNDTLVALEIGNRIFKAKYLYLGIQGVSQKTKPSMYKLEDIHDEKNNGYLFTYGTTLKYIILGCRIEYFCYLACQDMYLFKANDKNRYLLLNSEFTTPYNEAPYCCRTAFEVTDGNVKKKLSDDCKRENKDIIRFYTPEQFNELFNKKDY